MKNFILFGAAGFIAPRHLEAIKDTECNLLAVYDISDSVGIIDRYFPNADLFTNLEQVDSFISKNKNIDFISICTPNYLHFDHAKFSLERDINVICEKPLVLTSSELDALSRLENNSNANLFTILQLRLHPSVVELKESVLQSKDKSKYVIDLKYITSRGKWYLKSWKGDVHKSGGVATNIGVHFFDMLGHIFGEVTNLEIEHSDEKRVKGTLNFKNAEVSWFLSIDENDLPTSVKESGKKTFRSLRIMRDEFEFSDGFTDLHTQSYSEILKGNGFTLEDNRASIEIVERIRAHEQKL